MEVEMKSLMLTENKDEENFPTSFMKQEASVKTLCPHLRSYALRRNLSLAAVASIFIIIFGLVTMVIHFGEFIVTYIKKTLFTQQLFVHLLCGVQLLCLGWQRVYFEQLEKKHCNTEQLATIL